MHEDTYNIAAAEAFIALCANCGHERCVCGHPNYDAAEEEWRRVVLGEAIPERETTPVTPLRAEMLVEGIAAPGHITVEVPLTLPDGTRGVGYAAVAPDVPAATLAALGPGEGTGRRQSGVKKQSGGTPVTIVVDYNPLTESAPGPVGFRQGRTPEKAAQTRRALMIHLRKFPLAYADTFYDPDRRPELTNAFEFAWWVAVEAGCSMDEAHAATEEIAPELYADFWMPHWKVKPSEGSEG